MSMVGQQKIKLAYTKPSLMQIVSIHQDSYTTLEKEGPYYYYTKTAESVVDMAQGFMHSTSTLT